MSIEMVSVSDIPGERGGLLEGLLTTKNLHFFPLHLGS